MAGIPASHPVVFADPLPRVTRVYLPIIAPPPFDGEAMIGNPFSLPAQLPGRAPLASPPPASSTFSWLGGSFPARDLRFPPIEFRVFPLARADMRCQL